MAVFFLYLLVESVSINFMSLFFLHAESLLFNLLLLYHFLSFIFCVLVRDLELVMDCTVGRILLCCLIILHSDFILFRLLFNCFQT